MARKISQRGRSTRDRDIRQSLLWQEKAKILCGKIDELQKEIQRYKDIDAHRENADFADLDPRSQQERLQKTNAKLFQEIEELNRQDMASSKEYRRLENELMGLGPMLRALRQKQKLSYSQAKVMAPARKAGLGWQP